MNLGETKHSWSSWKAKGSGGNFLWFIRRQRKSDGCVCVNNSGIASLVPLPRYFFSSLVMPHLTAPHSCILSSTRLDTSREATAAPPAILILWHFPEQSEAGKLSCPALRGYSHPISHLHHQSLVFLTLSSPIIPHWELSWPDAFYDHIPWVGVPHWGKDGQENIVKLFHWQHLEGLSIPDSSAGCCKRDTFPVGSSQGKWFYLHICNSPGRGRSQRAQCHQMRIKLCVILQNVN